MYYFLLKLKIIKAGRDVPIITVPFLGPGCNILMRHKIYFSAKLYWKNNFRSWSILGTWQRHLFITCTNIFTCFSYTNIDMETFSPPSLFTVTITFQEIPKKEINLQIHLQKIYISRDVFSFNCSNISKEIKSCCHHLDNHWCSHSTTRLARQWSIPLSWLGLFLLIITIQKGNVTRPLLMLNIFMVDRNFQVWPHCLNWRHNHNPKEERLNSTSLFWLIFLIFYTAVNNTNLLRRKLFNRRKKEHLVSNIILSKTVCFYRVRSKQVSLYTCILIAVKGFASILISCR